MIISNILPHEALTAWLRVAHDDGQPDLSVEYRPRRGFAPPRVTVLRADGSLLSATEEREVRALLAAHAAEPLTMPTK